MLDLHKKVQGIAKGSSAVLIHARSYTQKNVFGLPSEALVIPFSIQKLSQKHQKLNSCQLTIQEPIFSVSNTEFEGGDDGHGHGKGTFLVK